MRSVLCWSLIANVLLFALGSQIHAQTSGEASHHIQAGTQGDAEAKQDERLLENDQREMDDPRGHDGANPFSRLQRNLIPPHVLLRNADALKLSAAQKTQIKQLVQAGRARRKTLLDEKRLAASELKEALDLLEKSQDQTSQSLNQRILTQTERYAKVQLAVRMARLELSLQTRSLLTPEQQRDALSIKRSAKGDQGEARRARLKARKERKEALRQHRLDRLERRREQLQKHHEEARE